MASSACHCAVVVKPRSSRDEIVGVATDDSGLAEVVVKVRSAPEGGKATKAVCKLVARALSIPASAVTVARGQTSRHKLLALDCEPQALEQWMEGLLQL